MLLLAGILLMSQTIESRYPEMAERIVHALRLAPDERVVLRLNPDVMPAFEPVVRDALRAAGARVETWAGRDIQRFEERLKDVTVYVWLPGASNVTTPDQSEALRKWTDSGGTRRELHFHWVEGTLNRDRSPAEHTAVFDRLYADALEIDYGALRTAQDEAVAALQSGEIRVTTPAGTDLRFRTGDRPFNKQNGDGSARRASNARMRIDRHIELPAGIVRVAPIESSVNGVMVVPVMLLKGTRALDARLEFTNGRVTKASARQGETDLLGVLKAVPALENFRELGIGFNPALLPPPGSSVLPYYGYGAGVLRLSLGDNEELAGAVRGGASMWLFFPDATVTVGQRTIVKEGKLAK